MPRTSTAPFRDAVEFGGDPGPKPTSTLPDGRGQQRRSPCGKWRWTWRRRRGHDHGQAPALTNLDIIRRVKQEFGAPTAAYQVSERVFHAHGGGEERLAGRERACALESLISIQARRRRRRILTYFAKRAATLQLQEGGWNMRGAAAGMKRSLLPTVTPHHRPRRSRTHSLSPGHPWPGLRPSDGRETAPVRAHRRHAPEEFAAALREFLRTRRPRTST